MSKTPIYLVAIWAPPFQEPNFKERIQAWKESGAEVFVFTSEQNRNRFIEDIESLDPEATLATAEDTVDEQHITGKAAS